MPAQIWARIWIGLIVVMGWPMGAVAQGLPTLECEVSPYLCPESVAAYLDGPAADAPDFRSNLGILAARLAQMEVTGPERRPIGEALALISAAMRPFDQALADRITVVAQRRAEDRDETPSPEPVDPIFASPS